MEGLLEAVQEALAALAKLNGGPLEERTPPFEFLLELWDGVCLWNSGRPQPAHWTAAVLIFRALQDNTFSSKCLFMSRKGLLMLYQKGSLQP